MTGGDSCSLVCRRETCKGETGNPANHHQQLKHKVSVDGRSLEVTSYRENILGGSPILVPEDQRMLASKITHESPPGFGTLRGLAKQPAFSLRVTQSRGDSSLRLGLATQNPFAGRGQRCLVISPALYSSRWTRSRDSGGPSGFLPRVDFESEMMCRREREGPAVGAGVSWVGI